ncbi:hypothetical protein vseg_006218 [Gypsophila vaccaria]
MTKMDCECLVEKICDLIHRFGARKFSFAGRLVLIKSVLTSLHSYCASLFVLPKGIVNRVEAICRNFLWDNSMDYMRAPLVAWNKICRPKEEGGLGIKDQKLSNLAMIGRLVHWVTEHKDSLWVKWVNVNHIKDQEWMDYTPSCNSSWVWRKICGVKQVLATGYSEGSLVVQQQGYTPAGWYDWLSGAGQQVPWARVVWSKWVTPKHQFIGWLLAHNALRTKDKLINIGLDIDHKCYMCDQNTETAKHLFLACQYSKKLVTELRTRVQIPLPDTEVLSWCIRNSGSQIQQGVQAALAMSAVYQVWRQRNQAKHEKKVMRPHKIAEQIYKELKCRIHHSIDSTISLTDREWLKQIKIG